MAIIQNKFLVLSAIGAAGIVSGCSSLHRNVDTDTAEARREGSFLPGSDDDRPQGQIASYIDRGSSRKMNTADQFVPEKPMTTTQAAPAPAPAPEKSDATVETSQSTVQHSLRPQELQFETNSAELTSEGRRDLERTAAVLSASENQKVVIEGFADSRGTSQYNMALSKRRAESVKRALIEMGAHANQISIRPEGETKPIATNATEAGRAKNRRAEIRPSG